MTKPTAARSLAPLLRPGSIAIVGASPKGRYASNIIENCGKVGFSGSIWPVNPNYKEISGLRCYSDLASLPHRPDCAIIVVPAKAAIDVVEEAIRLGIPSGIIVGQGFSDTNTEEGNRRQQRLRELCDASGMRVAGPNCLGVASFSYQFASTYAGTFPPARAGGISILSQSGGLMLAAGNVATDRSGGLNYLINCGNQAVVDLADYIDYLADDPETKVIACIMEGVRNGRRFREAVERATKRKPMVVLKLGRSETGQRATFAHTGTLAGRDEAFAALFRQNGVAMVNSIDGLIETSMLFALAPLPKGDGVGMVTISGGTNGLIADLGEAAGLRFPPFSPATNTALQNIFGVSKGLNNPCDATGWPQLNTPGHNERCLDVLIADEAIDLIGIVYRLQPDENQLRMLGEMRDKAKTTSKPIVFISTTSYTVREFRQHRPDLVDFPMLEDLEAGQRAVRHLIDYGHVRMRASSADVGARIVDKMPVEIAPGRTSLTEYESKRLLARAGLPAVKEALAKSATDVARAAVDIGFPVVLKIVSPDVMHKSDAGGVMLGLKTATEVTTACDTILRNVAKVHPDATIDGILVQEQVRDGIELILGMTLDDDLGPLLICGLGGVLVEVLGDVATRIPPLTPDDAREMLSELRGRRILDGYRGQPAADVDALVEAIVAFSRFIRATEGTFNSIDINPLIVRPKGKGVVIADALMIPASAVSK